MIMECSKTYTTQKVNLNIHQLMSGLIVVYVCIILISKRNAILLRHATARKNLENTK